MSVESEVIRRIRPSEEDVDEICHARDSLIDEVTNYVKNNDIDVKIRFVGSVEKGTYLSNPDLDLFLMFPESVSKEEMIRLGLKIGKDVVNGQKTYSDHPYTRGKFHGFDVDVVPCYNVSTAESILTPVDRSPFHADYIKSRVNPDMVDEIRLMKKFMKGIGVYGAEPKVRGFSGYMCELITIYYGGFRNALLEASKWKKGTTISIEKSGPPMSAPFVLYDPVDSKRNVAAAVHIDTLAKFIVACGEYLKKPSTTFFYPNEFRSLSREQIKKKVGVHGTKLVTVIFDSPNINEDNFSAQVWKTQYALTKKFDLFSFGVLRVVHGYVGTKIVFVFELERDVLPRSYKHVGPPIWVKSSDLFLTKQKEDNNEPFIENGRWMVISKRPYLTAGDMIKHEVSITGIGKEIDPRTIKTLDHESTINGVDLSILTELMNPRYSWER
ncbi:MAG: CCA tRNA nucleotidyltransferase [archaeon]|nr:CCA tRNA nucleotidyltransferase [archaeon]